MKKSSFMVFLVIPMVSILPLSCEKECSPVSVVVPIDTIDSIDNRVVDIYMAGISIGATYWKNGLAVELPTVSGNNSGARSIFIDGTDIYVAGWEGDSFMYGDNIAKYWKNGEEVLLTGATGAEANSIVVVDGDVYVAGWEFTGSRTAAKYWKNGQPVNLTNGQYDAEATDIVVVDGNVYVCGHEKNAAKYWKNGQPVTLSRIGSAQAYANSIVVVGTDVYVAGSETEGRHRAKYWKNGESVTLIDGTEKFATASSIVVDGNDIYVAGWAGDSPGLVGGTGSIAMYWKNGQRVDLTDGVKYAHARSIAFFGGDVYVSGNIYDNNATPVVVAMYWKNEPDMSTSLEGSTQVMSIVVVPQ